ncbi:MAG: glycosyltransferase [Acaryochloridaceae cyanobacterium RU_4_10]|nr:glycosyltransferase [Acaryochloridaceae cyanobacterium RU_4_10]
MDSSVLTISIGLLWFLNGTFWVLGVLFLSEIWAAKPPADALSPTGWVDTRQRLAVLIPAHNEETEIAETIQSILPQMKEGDRLIAIADNCSDRTAAVARDAGATVLERTDRVLRGEGLCAGFWIAVFGKGPTRNSCDRRCGLRSGGGQLKCASPTGKGQPTSRAEHLFAETPEKCNTTRPNFFICVYPEKFSASVGDASFWVALRVDGVWNGVSLVLTESSFSGGM